MGGRGFGCALFFFLLELRKASLQRKKLMAAQKSAERGKRRQKRNRLAWQPPAAQLPNFQKVRRQLWEKPAERKPTCIFSSWGGYLIYLHSTRKVISSTLTSPSPPIFLFKLLYSYYGLFCLLTREHIKLAKDHPFLNELMQRIMLWEQESYVLSCWLGGHQLS